MYNIQLLHQSPTSMAFKIKLDSTYTKQINKLITIWKKSYLKLKIIIIKI